MNCHIRFRKCKYSNCQIHQILFSLFLLRQSVILRLCHARLSEQPYDSESTADNDVVSVYSFCGHLRHESMGNTRYTRRFKSRLNKGGVDKPWLLEKDPREKWVTILPIIGVLFGCGLAAYLGYS